MTAGDDLTIRKAEPADGPQILALLHDTRSTPPSPHDEAFLAWKHSQSPFGPPWHPRAGGRHPVRRGGGRLLGIVPAASVVDESHTIGPGEALVLYTDGITERHRGDRFFGEQGITATLAACRGLSPDAIAGCVEEAARAFVEGQPTDDMAVVVVRVPPTPG